MYLRFFQNLTTLCFVYKKLLYKKVEAQIVQKLRNLLYDDVIVTIKGFEAHFRKQLSYKKVECMANKKAWFKMFVSSN